MTNKILNQLFSSCKKWKTLVLISMLLTLGVGQMWAMDVRKPKVYFNNQTPNWNTSNFYFAVGHNSYTRLYYTTTIPNTKLQYVDLGTYDCSYCSCDCQQWGDATYVAFCRTTSAWDQAGSYGYSNISNAQKYSGQKNSYNMNSGNTYYCYMANANNGATLSVDYKSSGYSDIPKFNATQSAKKRDSGTTYSTVSGSWPATLNLQGTYLSGDGTSAQSTITSTKASDDASKKTYGAVVTGEITHSYESLSSSYYFEGWGTSSTPSSTDDTYSYNISAATTVYAFFSKKYTLTYDRKGTYGSSTLSVAVSNFSGTKTSGSAIPTGHQITFTASPASGYVIEGWYSDAACTASLNNGQNTTYTITSLNANTSVYVKFEELKTITIKFAHEATDGWTIQGVTKYPTSGGQSISANGTWVTMTFTNVYAVSNIDLAYAGGGEWDFLNTSTKITDDCCYNKDGSLNASCCVPRANPTWGTAPANGAVGGSMTASVSGAPTGATTTWTSTNTSAATVSSSGVISYRAVGNTTIKANVSWGASGDYCAGSYELSQAISVTSGATVSATRACPEYVSSNSGQVKLDISSTGASTGWYYRVCNSTKTAYYAPDEQSAASNTLSWTMNGSLPTGSNTLVVELYNSARQLVCTSSSVTVNVEIAESVTISAGAHGSVSPSGIVYANNNHVHPSITATANTNYHFVNWTSSYPSSAWVASAKSATTTVTATASGYTITANFAGDQYSITYKDKGNVAYTGNNEGSLPATHTYGTATTLVNGSKTGFTFDGWYTDAACTVSAGSSIGATAKTSNFTLYAKWTENMSTLSTSNHYDAGDPGYAAPTVSGSATTVGYGSTRTITATAAGTGYTFAGWTLTNCTRTDGGAATATSITIRSNGDGAAASVVANYEEVLTQNTWILKGGTAFGGSAWTTEHALTKKTGHATEDIVYATFTISETNTGASNDNFKFKIVKKEASDSYFGLNADGSYYLMRGESGTEKTLATENADIQLRADVVGDYIFKVDYSNPSSPKLTVTFPTKYTVTYGVGTDYTSMGSVSTVPDIASGAEVSAGTNISFTATPNPGYKFVGWYSNDACTSSLSTDNPYIVTVNAATTVYAKFELLTLYMNSDINNWESAIALTHTSENPAVYTYTGTLNANPTTDATYASGWHFEYCYNEARTEKAYQYTTVQTLPPSGSSIDGIHTYSGANTIQFGLTRKSDVTITLTLQTPPTKPTVNIVALPYYTVTLDLEEDHKGTTAGATTSQIVTLNAVTTTVPNRPTGAEGYGLDGYYTDHNGAGTKLINGDGTWIASVDGYTDADKKWIYDGDLTLYAYYKMAEIASITVSPAIVAPRETVSATPVYSPAPDGTTRICWEVQYSNGTPLPSQPTFTTEGSTVSFQAPESSATYRIEAKLYTGSTCGGGTLLSTQYATFQVAGSHTVTVQYMCGDMVIKAATEMTGKPLEWSEEFTAPTITGYTFTRWDAGDGVTIKNGSSDPVTTSTNQTIQIKAVYDGTLTAVYSKRRLIFFYNTLGWENVYVYFYKNDSYWQTVSPYNGTGANKNFTYTNTPYSEELHGQMLPISEGSSIYYFDAEAEGVNASYTTVAFTEANQHGYEYFWKTNAVRRSDYKSTTMPMFVPLADQTADVHNQTNYYNHGYWMNYPENTGYTLKIYNAWNVEKETGAVREFPFPYSADKKMPLKMDVEFNDAGTHEYWFMVYRNDGVYMGNLHVYKQGDNDEQVITGGNNKSKLITSAPGNYTFTLTYHDNGSGTVNYYIDLDFPIANNDYRIVYNDRVKWSSNTAHTASWYHPSNIIRQIENGATEPKKDTASFFISKAAGANASMKFQKASVTGEGVITWTDVASGTIDIPSSVSESGVYNFIVSQPVGGGSIALEKVEPYTGSYYIRTDCAGSTKWDSYKATDHMMTYSDYAAASTDGFTHYYAHWVTGGTNIKFCIANDYSMAVSDSLESDTYTNQSLVANANIRFMYDKRTNVIKRAYISGSGTITDRFLVLEGDAKMYDENGNALTGDNQDHDKYGNYLGTDNQVILHDDENFVYERTIMVNPQARAKLTAKFNNNVQYFKGSAGDFGDGTTVQLLGGETSSTKWKMRIVYDFKTNRLVAAYLPEGEIDGNIAINADVMIIREHQGEAQQIKFTTNASTLDEVKTVYGVMRFNRWTLNNKDKNTHNPVGDPKSPYERALYWISFPFDVNLSDVFGFGTYGEDWIIEYYDGASRAANGYWIDSPSFWRYVMPSQRATYTLEKGKGYVLALDIDRMKDNNTSFWTNNIEQIELFFPSASPTIGTIGKTTVKTTVPSYECTIDRRTDKTKPDVDKDRTRADSHWNMIGIPSYANYGTTITSDGESAVITWNTNPYTNDLPFLYEWNMVDDSYTVQSGTTYPFKSMHAYMVQYHGDMYWSLASATPSSIIARRTYEEKPNEIEFRLELQQNDKMIDQTFIKLSEKEEVSANFNFDEDLCKEFNKSKPNIYTIVETYIPVAGNILPLSEQTTLVPVGVKTSADGDYTFSMPNGTDGVGVTLKDGVTGERTNLALMDYTVSLEKGTYDQRFVLEISPIEHTTTAIENSEKTDAPNNVCKKLIDGVLYIIKDGKVFDARGARLQ